MCSQEFENFAARQGASIDLKYRFPLCYAKMNNKNASVHYYDDEISFHFQKVSSLCRSPTDCHLSCAHFLIHGKSQNRPVNECVASFHLYLPLPIPPSWCVFRRISLAAVATTNKFHTISTLRCVNQRFKF